jgi:hypothetical protein
VVAVVVFSGFVKPFSAVFFTAIGTLAHRSGGTILFTSLVGWLHMQYYLIGMATIVIMVSAGYYKGKTRSFWGRHHIPSLWKFYCLLLTALPLAVKAFLFNTPRAHISGSPVFSNSALMVSTSTVPSENDGRYTLLPLLIFSRRRGLPR